MNTLSGSLGGLCKSVFHSALSKSGPKTTSLWNVTHIMPPNYSQQQQQRRWNWQIHLPNVYDPETRRYKWDDWSNHLNKFQQPTLANGQTVLKRYQRQPRHLKKWMIKKMMKEQGIYKRQQERIANLQSYIQFMHKHGNMNK